MTKKDSRLLGANGCGCCKSDEVPVSDGLAAAFGLVAVVAASLPDLSEVRDSTEDEELPLLGRLG